MSLPRNTRMKLKRQITDRPGSNLSYLPLVDNLSQAMLRSYVLGYRSKSQTLKADTKKARLALYKPMARETLRDYQRSANAEIKRVYRSARDAGASVKNASALAQKRFSTLGHTAPVSNRLETLYRSAMRSAYQQGIYDASRTDAAVWGYKFIAREVGGRKHPTTRDSHYQFNGVTLPKEDPFWNKVWPPLSWNCYCRIQTYKRKQKVVKPPPRPMEIEAAFQGQGFRLE